MNSSRNLTVSIVTCVACCGIAYGAPKQTAKPAAKPRLSSSPGEPQRKTASNTDVQTETTQSTAATAAQQESQKFLASLGERLAALEERVLGLQHPLDSIVERTNALESEIFGGATTNDNSQVVERITRLENTVFRSATKDAQVLPDGMSTYVETRKPARRTSGKLPN